MFRQSVASVIVVLILLPFTAPFSTYDVARPFGRKTRQGAPFTPQATADASVESAAALVPARVVTGRARLVPLVGPRLTCTGPASPANVSPIRDSSSPPQRSAALLTILRL